MPFLALDHSFVKNPKIIGLSDRAFRLHVLALCYCAEHMTDGFVPVSAKLWGELGSNRRRSEELVRAQLWVEVEGGFMVHDYLDWNASAAQIKEKRAKDRARKIKQAYQDSEGNPSGKKKRIRADSTGTTPREVLRTSLKGQPAKSADPEINTNERTPEPDLPPADERQRIAAELRAKLLGAPATRTLGDNGAAPPLEFFLDTEPAPEDTE